MAVRITSAVPEPQGRHKTGVARSLTLLQSMALQVPPSLSAAHDSLHQISRLFEERFAPLCSFVVSELMYELGSKSKQTSMDMGPHVPNLCFTKYEA